jgi:SET domain-containing protein
MNSKSKSSLKFVGDHPDYYINKSSIHGDGVFLNRDFREHEPIDAGIKLYFGIIPYVTSNFGSLINHSWDPNTYLKWDDQNSSHMVCAKQNLPTGMEITLNYEDTPWYILAPNPNWK